MHQEIHAITLGNTLHVTGLATPVVHFLKEHFKFSSDILDTQLIDGYKEVENKKGHPVKTKGPFELTPQWYEDPEKQMMTHGLYVKHGLMMHL